jgi:hypothetical protein
MNYVNLFKKNKFLQIISFESYLILFVALVFCIDMPEDGLSLGQNM